MSTEVSRQTLWQYRQRRLRRCSCCGGALPLATRPGTTRSQPEWRCERCAQVKNQRRRERRAIYRAQGRCTECGGPKNGLRRDRCQQCA